MMEIVTLSWMEKRQMIPGMVVDRSNNGHNHPKQSCHSVTSDDEKSSGDWENVRDDVFDWMAISREEQKSVHDVHLRARL
jgi:hypothetical protein